MNTAFNRQHFWKKMIPLIVLLLGLVAFFYFRLYRYFNFDALQTYRSLLTEWMQHHFILSSLSFITVYIIIVAISAPIATFLTLLGGFLFGPIIGTVYVVISATIGATLIFLATRFALRDYFHQKLGDRFHRIKTHIQQQATSYLLFVRFLPIFPFWLINILAALAGIKTTTFVITTLIGILPVSTIYVLLGNSLNILFTSGEKPNLSIIFQPMILIPLIGLGILSLLPILYRAWFQKKWANK